MPAAQTPVLTNSPIGMPRAEPYKRLNELDESRSSGMMSRTPKGDGSLSRCGRHWRKEGTLTRGDPDSL